MCDRVLRAKHLNTPAKHVMDAGPVKEEAGWVGSAKEAPHTDGFLFWGDGGGATQSKGRFLLCVCGTAGSGPGLVLRGADVLTAALALATTCQQPVPLLHHSGL